MICTTPRTDTRMEPQLNTFRAGNSCPLQFCPNHSCYPSPAGQWFVRKEAQGEHLVSSVKVKCPGRDQGAHKRKKKHQVLSSIHFYQQRTRDKRMDSWLLGFPSVVSLILSIIFFRFLTWKHRSSPRNASEHKKKGMDALRRKKEKSKLIEQISWKATK